jgi:hypothetical protein
VQTHPATTAKIRFDGEAVISLRQTIEFSDELRYNIVGTQLHIDSANTSGNYGENSI